MVTVPCCVGCQKRYKKDEDVFVAWLNFGPTGATKAGKALWGQKLKRTYRKDYGIRKIMAKSFKSINLVTPGGIYLGRRLAISVDQQRLSNILKKIIRALFWVEYKVCLPEEIPISIIRVQKNDARIDELISLTQQASTFWENIFEYRHVWLDKTSFESLWAMSFYRQNYFIAIVDKIRNIA